MKIRVHAGAHKTASTLFASTDLEMSVYDANTRRIPALGASLGENAAARMSVPEHLLTLFASRRCRLGVANKKDASGVRATQMRP